MKGQPHKVLLIASSEKKESCLAQFINEKGYQVEILTDIEPTIERIMNKDIDLVISDNSIKGYSGFEVFKLLAEYLRNNDIPFFLVLETYVMEYILFGLEIGIDNFIICPINKDTLYSKIENQLRKKEQINVFESDNFLEYFHASSIAMFFLLKNKINLVNSAFIQLFKGRANSLLGLPFSRAFNFAESKQNELAYQRFIYDITKHCKLIQVPCFDYSNFSYDISLYRGNKLGIGTTFAEIVPSAFTCFGLSNKSGVLPDRENMEKRNDESNKPAYFGKYKLTERQKEVYELSAIGMPIKLIADKLNLSEGTVEKHRENIMLKTKSKNIIEAIVRIQRNNENIMVYPE